MRKGQKHSKEARKKLSESARKRTGSKNPNWKGGIVNFTGRVLIYCPNHPNPNYCNTHVFRYRLVMEEHLGRYLDKNEIVHHTNGIVDDDRVENLQIMTQSEHARLHFTKTKKGEIK